jgi:hypothetical protein
MMIITRLLPIIFLASIQVTSISQDLQATKEVAEKPTSVDTIANIGFQTASKPALVLHIDEKHFNQGNINDPLQLIQGKASGLLIARPGSDPNEGFTARIRGISSLYMSSSPLLIIDGFPSASTLNLDPLDVQKISVLKDAASSSQYGLRSLGGAIAFETWSGAGTGLTIKNYTSIETPNPLRPQILTPQEFISAGGNDFRSKTSWYDQITNKAISNATHISYGQKIANSEFYGSLTYRNVNGVLTNSGFSNLNFRVRYKQTFANNKLSLDGRFSHTDRTSSFSFPQAFKYARTYNPTVPVFDNTGNYLNLIAYDVYNPVAMVKLNVNDANLRVDNASLRLSYRLSKDLEINAFYGNETITTSERTYASRNSYWMGGFDNNGLRDQQNQSLSSTYSMISANYNKNINRTWFSSGVNYSSQNYKVKQNFAEATNFASDDLGKASVHNSISGNLVQSGFSQDKTMRSFRANIEGNTSNLFFFGSNICIESLDSVHATTFGLTTGINLIRNKNKVLSEFKTRLSYGQSAGGLSFFQNYNPGNLLQGWQLSSSPFGGAQAETKGEVNFGIDWANSGRKLWGSIDFFSGTTKNVLAQSFRSSNNTLFIGLSNRGDVSINNRGIELEIHRSLVETKNIKLTTGLNFSTIKNTFSIGQNINFYSFPEAIAFHTGGTYMLTNGNPIGQIQGYQYKNISNSRINFIDRNGDGIVDSRDQYNFGQPLPNLFYGWSTDFQFHHVRLNMLIRGAAGHYVFNAYRLSYENPGAIFGYNLPLSAVTGDVKTAQQGFEISNFYSEKASYVKLDNVSIYYDIVLTNRSLLTIYFAAQNLFTVTNYSGSDPEVRLNYKTSQMSAGFDSQYTYGSTKTFLAGVQFKL